MSQLIRQSHASTGVPLWKSESAISGGSFTAEFPDIWAGSPPTTIDDAVNRLSMILYARTSGSGTLNEPSQQSTILVETNGFAGDSFLVKYSQDGIPIWKARLGGILAETINSVATDPLGNIYITGQYPGNFTIFNSDGTTFGTVDFLGFQNNCFVIKYNANGFAQWSARNSGVNATSIGYFIGTDSSGNVYVSSNHFNNPLTIFNSDGTTFTTLTRIGGGNNTILIKYNTNGMVQWLSRINDSGDNGAGSVVSVMPSGEVYITGVYSGSPLTILNSDGTTFGTLANSGSFDYYLVKYNTSGFGQWSTRVAGTGAEGGFPSIKVGATGNVYITGTYASSPLTIFNSDTTTFGTLANSGSDDIFVVKYNTSGFGQWATRIAGTSQEGAERKGITIDASENVYLTSGFASFLLTLFNADGSTFRTIQNTGNADGILVKYNTDGVGQWATHQAGGGNGVSYSVAVDSMGNVYQYLYLAFLSILYNADGTIFQLVSSEGGTTDNVLIKYNVNGMIQWFARQTGAGNEFPRGVATHSTDVVVAGSYASVPFFIRSAGL